VHAAPKPAAPRSSSARSAKSDRERRVERKARAAERHLERVRARFNAFNDALEARGLARLEGQAVIPLRTWNMATDILADASGRAGRIWLARLAKRFPHAAGAIRMAAVVPTASGQVHLWSDDRARRIVALGCALLELSRNTRRKGQFRLMVAGITRSSLEALIGNVWTGERPSHSALSCRQHAGASLLAGGLGYLRALESAGFMYRQQIHEPARQLPCERNYPKGHPPNRYWLVARPVHDVAVAALVRLVELEELGWTVRESADARLTRVLRAALIVATAADAPPAAPD
jgi:hypothetical protein